MFPKCAHSSAGLSCTISRLSLLLAAAVPGPNVSGAGMTGERSQSACLALRRRAPREFHTHYPLVSHRSCHFPLLSIRAALSQQEGGCAAGDCRGSGVHRGARLCSGGPEPLGAPFKGPPKQDGTPYPNLCNSDG